MRSALALAALVAFSCTGVVGETGGGGGGSAGGAGGGDNPACAALALAITSPAATSYTNGTVQVEVSATGVSSVDLMVDGAQLASLAAPYHYAWDTKALSEGNHVLVARATSGALTCNSSAVVVVDRTAPTVVSRTPAPGSSSAWYAQGANVTFSEAMAPASVGVAGSVSVDAGVSAQATLSASGITLSVAFAAPPPLQRPIEVSLGASLTDLAGNALAATSWAWQFPLWGQVGGQIGAGVRTGGGALVLDGAGNPVVARYEFVPGASYLPRVSRWDGAAWKDLGAIDAIADAGLGAYPVGLVLTPQGQPAVFYLASVDAGSLNQANVSQWDGAAWQPLGGPLGAPTPDGWSGALAIESTGTLVAAFTDGPDVRVARFTAGTWQLVGGSLNVIGGAKGQTLSLALDANDRPVVAFREIEASGRRQLYVKRWSGSAWMQLGGALNSADVLQYSGQPVALDTAGTPYVLHDEQSGPFAATLRVEKWNGSAWERVGPPLNVSPGSKAFGQHLRIDAQGRLLAGWAEQRPNDSSVLPFTGYVARFEQGQWQVLGPGFRQGQGPSVWQTQIDGVALWRGEPVVMHSEYSSTPGVTAIFVHGYNAPPQAPYGLEPANGPSPCVLPATPPMLLSATGCFTDLLARTPAAGVWPYRVNSALWTDAAAKQRWLVLPGDGGTLAFTNDAGSWDAPVGTLLIKEFDVEQVPGNEATARPMETRFLVRRDAATWEGYSYQWRDTFDEADLLVGTSGVTKGWPTDAGLHDQYYPSRSECLQCHSSPAGRVLGLQTAQLHGVLDYGVAVDDQLRALNHAGAFGSTFPTGALGDLPRLPNPYDSTEPLPDRARSYLHANCVHCHSGFLWDARFTTPMGATGLCGAAMSIPPSIAGNNRVTAGDAGTSEIVRRMGIRGPGQMPRLGTLAVDDAALATVSAWINGMTSCP